MNAEQACLITREYYKQKTDKEICWDSIELMAKSGLNYTFCTGSKNLFEELENRGFKITNAIRSENKKMVSWKSN